MLRILIADDHEIARRGLEQLLLEEYPFAYIEKAEEGKILVTKASGAEWDIVIADLSMPVMTGLEALREIRRHFPNLPVLILSMHAESRHCISALKAGASGYISKTMAHDELINAVRKILSGKKYIPASLIFQKSNITDHHSDTKPHLLLSGREFSVFKFLASGKPITKISEMLSISTSSISTYRFRILEKMSMGSNAEIIRYAIEQQLL